MRLVRSLLTTTFLAAGLGGAAAADYLRGSLTEPVYQPTQLSSAGSYNWAGFYFGGNASTNHANINNSGMAGRLARLAFPNLTVTDQIVNMVRYGEGKTSATGYAVFGGYNTQWDDVVMGLEGEFGRMRLKRTDSVGVLARQLFGTGNTTTYYNTYIDNGSIKNELSDYGVARVRVGAAFDRVLPYMTLGVALARREAIGSIGGRVNAFSSDGNGGWVAAGSIANSQVSKENGLAWGYAAGLGVDWAILDNVFVRANYEYLAFGGDKTTRYSIQTGRLGAGVKF